MKFSVQTGGMAEKLGLEQTYRLIAETGFDSADAGLDMLFSVQDVIHGNIPEVFRPGLGEKEMLEYFRPYKDYAEKYGITHYQAHAPFPSTPFNPVGVTEEYNEFLIDMLRKTIVGAAYIDCHNLVIHPFFYDYDHRVFPQEQWDLNIRQYLKLAETAEKYDVTICLENLFTDHKGKIYADICNEPGEAARYVDTLNEAAGKKVFGFCLDTGHALMVGKNIRDFMDILGDRICAFHVHDNNGIYDQHLAPYMGIQDWDLFIQGLKDIHYDKTLDFETYNIWNTIDPELCPDVLKVILKTGKMFARRAGV